MSHSDRSYSHPAPITVIGAWFSLTAAWVCIVLWVLDKHPSRVLLAGGIACIVVWATFWLDHLQRALTRCAATGGYR